MFEKKLLYFSLSAVVLSSTLFAQVNITLVSSDGSSDPMVNYLNTNFTNVGTITTGTFTSGAGSINSGDLVIFSRNTNSGSYDDSAAEIDSWNDLSNDMLALSAYVVRDSRLGWVDTVTVLNDVSASGNPGEESTIFETGPGTTDTIFNGITVNNLDGPGGDYGTADLYNSSTDALDALTTDFGGGTPLARLGNNNEQVIARFSTGDALATVTGTSTTHGGDRLFYAFNSGGNPDDFLSSDGQVVLNNMLSEFGLTAIPEPSSFVLVMIASMGLLCMRQRK